MEVGVLVVLVVLVEVVVVVVLVVGLLLVVIVIHDRSISGCSSAEPKKELHQLKSNNF